MQRFKMICNAAKGMSISIWVIAFGTTLSAEMQECASNANQASTVGQPRRADRPLPPDRQQYRRAEADPMSRRLASPRASAATQRGATIVEFALVLPVLCVLLLGMLDLGYRSYVTSIVQGALHEAARMATVGGVTT